jgi:hypothetical protein
MDYLADIIRDQGRQLQRQSQQMEQACPYCSLAAALILAVAVPFQQMK